MSTTDMTCPKCKQPIVILWNPHALATAKADTKMKRDFVTGIYFFTCGCSWQVVKM